jgi:hypothetical protein
MFNSHFFEAAKFLACLKNSEPRFEVISVYPDRHSAVLNCLSHISAEKMRRCSIVVTLSKKLLVWWIYRYSLVTD